MTSRHRLVIGSVGRAGVSVSNGAHKACDGATAPGGFLDYGLLQFGVNYCEVAEAVSLLVEARQGKAANAQVMGLSFLIIKPSLRFLSGLLINHNIMFTVIQHHIKGFSRLTHKLNLGFMWIARQPYQPRRDGGSEVETEARQR